MTVWLERNAPRGGRNEFSRRRKGPAVHNRNDTARRRRASSTSCMSTGPRRAAGPATSRRGIGDPAVRTIRSEAIERSVVTLSAKPWLVIQRANRTPDRRRELVPANPDAGQPSTRPSPQVAAVRSARIRDFLEIAHAAEASPRRSGREIDDRTTRRAVRGRDTVVAAAPSVVDPLDARAQPVIGSGEACASGRRRHAPRASGREDARQEARCHLSLRGRHYPRTRLRGDPSAPLQLQSAPGASVAFDERTLQCERPPRTGTRPRRLTSRRRSDPNSRCVFFRCDMNSSATAPSIDAVVVAERQVGPSAGSRSHRRSRRDASRSSPTPRIATCG